MAAGTVSAKVRAAHRGRHLLVGVESAIVGLSAGIATLAAATAARADPRDVQMVALLGFVAILAALSWWLERRRDVSAIARAIDRRAGLGGALTTAFEADEDSDRSPIAAALALRVAPVVRTRRFLRNEAQASSAVLAAPFLAAALLGAALEGRSRSDGPRAHGQAASAGSWTVLGRAANLRAEVQRLASSPDRSAEDAAALRSLAERTSRLASRAADPEASIADLEREVSELSRRIEDLRDPASGAGVASGEGDGTMGGRDPPIDRPADGSMRDTPPSNPPAETPSEALPAAAAGVRTEGGVGASRWWPERYDGVVERWVEARRAAAGGRSR